MADARRDGAAMGAEIVAGQTLRDALQVAARRLLPFDAFDAGVDARRLLLHAISADVMTLVRTPERRLTAGEADAFAAMLDRRSAGEPVSRIVGWRGFYGREFRINAATLDPRPESETLIEVALKLVAATWPRGEGLEFLDIGVGSGCLLVTLLAELPEAHGVGVDVSAAALAVSADNAERHGVGDRCLLVEGRSFAGLARRFPLILSNPPYIATDDIAGLARDVRQFDPVGALNGGVDGLDIYREIARDLDAHAAAPGWVVLESGLGQVEQISQIFMDALPPARLGTINVHADMAGQSRCVVIKIQN